MPFKRETIPRARLEAAPSDPTTLHEPLDLYVHGFICTTHCCSCCSHQSLPKRCWTPPAHQRWPNLMENQNNNLKIITSRAFLKTLYNLDEVSRITTGEDLHLFHSNLHLLTIPTYLSQGQDVTLLLAGL